MVAHIQPPQTWYAYTYGYPDGYMENGIDLTDVVFYVGKGKKGRIDDHEREAQKGCECKKCQNIRDIWERGYPIKKRIVFETLIEDDALTKEKDLICEYAGPFLTNIMSVGRKKEVKRKAAKQEEEVFVYTKEEIAQILKQLDIEPYYTDKVDSNQLSRILKWRSEREYGKEHQYALASTIESGDLHPIRISEHLDVYDVYEVFGLSLKIKGAEVHLRQLRIQAHWTLEQMSEKLGISIATLARIEAKERKKEKYVMDERNISRIVEAVNHLFQQSYTAQDLESIEIAPPRTGRPRKKKEGENA